VARASDPCAAPLLPFARFRDVDGACVDRAEAATVDGIMGVVSSASSSSRGGALCGGDGDGDATATATGRDAETLSSKPYA